MSTPVRVERPARGQPFEWRANYFALGSLVLSAHRFTGKVAAETDAVGDFFSLAISIGAVYAESFQGSQTIPMVTGKTGFIGSPGQRAGARLQSGYEGIHMNVPSGEMESALAALHGARPRAPLRFEPRVSLSSQTGAAFLRLLRFTMDEADRPDSALASPLVAARMAEALVFSLLLAQPHDQLDNARTDACEPAHVRRAAEYLDANLAQPIRMTELATVTGVSVRSIQVGFQKHRGCSPLEFLRTRRLLRARSMLLNGTDASVTEVALACGFEHLGRFSAAYKARFGERPVDTCRVVSALCRLAR
jgi:AraC-like DNA-binding protein